MSHDGRLLIIIMVTSIGAYTASPTQDAFAAPCTCEDIPDIEQYLQDRNITLSQWKQVVDAVRRHNSQSPITPKEAQDLFHDMFGQGQKVDSPGGEGDPNFKKDHCDTIVDSDKLHEKLHKVDYVVESLPDAIKIFAGNSWSFAETEAESEVNVREHEIDFLESALKKLRPTCRWTGTISFAVKFKGASAGTATYRGDVTLTSKGHSYQGQATGTLDYNETYPNTTPVYKKSALFQDSWIDGHCHAARASHA